MTEKTERLKKVFTREVKDAVYDLRNLADTLEADAGEVSKSSTTTAMLVGYIGQTHRDAGNVIDHMRYLMNKMQGLTADAAAPDWSPEK